MADVDYGGCDRGMNIRIISALPCLEDIGPQKLCADSDDGKWHFFGVYEDDGPIPGYVMAEFRKQASLAFDRARDR